MSHSGHSAEGRGLSLHEVTRRVQKLIAVAERTTHPDESDAFSRKAAELIARYRLSAEALRPRQPDEYVIHELVLGRGAYVRARFSLLSGVADAMGCLATFLTGPSGTTAQISGPLREVEAVEVLFNSLHQQMATQASKQRRTTSAATQRFRRAFMFGFAERISEMLHEVPYIVLIVLAIIIVQLNHLVEYLQCLCIEHKGLQLFDVVEDGSPVLCNQEVVKAATLVYEHISVLWRVNYCF